MLSTVTLRSRGAEPMPEPPEPKHFAERAGAGTAVTFYLEPDSGFFQGAEPGSSVKLTRIYTRGTFLCTRKEAKNIVS